jgi:hypothetical protein
MDAITGAGGDDGLTETQREELEGLLESRGAFGRWRLSVQLRRARRCDQVRAFVSNLAPADPEEWDEETAVGRLAGLVRQHPKSAAGLMLMWLAAVYSTWYWAGQAAGPAVTAALLAALLLLPPCAVFLAMKRGPEK